jgi:UPF0271 protein
VGEWTGDDPARDTDAALIGLVTSVNVACGAHAGDAASMERTVALAASMGVAVGAHPGYPDREGFGRRDMDLPTEALRLTLVAQIGALRAVCRVRGVTMTHVKPHGALYNQASWDPSLAGTVAEIVRSVDPGLALLGLAGSVMGEAAAAAGLRPVAEAFADRAYEPDGRLRSRSQPDAVHQDPDVVASQAVSIARDGRVRAVDGSWVAIHAESICLHGDTPRAVANARWVRAALEVAGIDVRAFARP